MRVLWFTHSSSNYPVRNGKYNGAGWVSSLETRVASEVELGVCFVMAGQPAKVESGGVTYYPVPDDTDTRFSRIKYLFVRETRRYDSLVKRFVRVVEDFKPDIIEVFGSEHAYGLISERVKIPVIVHLQGIINACFDNFLPPDVSMGKYFNLSSGIPEFLWKVYYWRHWDAACIREQKILADTRYVMGRTAWDRMASWTMNHNHRYYHCDEIIRPEFYEAEPQTVSPDKLKIVTTVSEAPYKGVDLVLRTALLLKSWGREFEWKVFGNVNVKFFEKVTGITADDAGVEFCGVADAATLVRELQTAAMYVHPSYIENSPNSVCEAQMLGVPVVASDVGGVYSIVDDEHDGFLAMPGDEEDFMDAIKVLWVDKGLARELGDAGRRTALERHDREKIVSDLLGIYEDVIAHYKFRLDIGSE
ncbi:MAG: glycosyltransferase [Bacteroidales bacterium]|nr:glycosyltransferase [Bacteroidales bacterium]